MAGSTIGRNFCVTTWGESHGKALGVVIDGCPAGIDLSEEDLQRDLDRRKPGSSKYTTKRAEGDRAEILSGVFQGRTTGTPISIIIYNEDQRSRDYTEIAQIYRPGHADFGYDSKYGFRDYRGGGRSSGRETAARVAAGAVARKVLGELGVTVDAYTLSIGPVSVDKATMDIHKRFNNPLVMPEEKAYEDASAYLEACMAKGDSCGGIAECVISGIKPGVGEPVFRKLDAELAKAMLSIGGVKGVEFGLGFDAAEVQGSLNNDPFYWQEGKIVKSSNHAGGVLGGMADGSDVIFRLPFKPTPSISALQHTAAKDGQNREISIKGRHDPIIIARAIVVVEAMAAMVAADLIMQNCLSHIEGIKNLYL